MLILVMTALMGKPLVLSKRPYSETFFRDVTGMFIAYTVPLMSSGNAIQTRLLSRHALAFLPLREVALPNWFLGQVAQRFDCGVVTQVSGTIPFELAQVGGDESPLLY